jgi:hypothetical protein
MDRMLSYSKTAMERAMKVQGVISRAKGEQDHAMAGSRKNGGRDGAVEKTRDGKVKKPTFPPRLEIPQTPRDSHFPTASATAGD